MPKKPVVPVRPQDISLQAKKKDVTLLGRYAKEQGAAALPFLDTALTQGNKALRRAAVEAMRSLDGARAERQVQAMRAALAGKTTKAAASEREELQLLLLWLATPSSVKAFLAEGGDVNEARGGFDRVALDRALLAYFTSEGPGLPAAELEDLLARAFEPDPLRHHWYENTPAARRLAEALLKHRSHKIKQYGARLLCGASQVEGLAELAAQGQRAAVGLAIEVCQGLDKEEQFEALSGYIDEPADRALVLEAIDEIDPRWTPRLVRFIDEPGAARILLRLRHPEALRRQRALADREVFDSATRNACYELGSVGDAEATPILLRWLRDPVGRGASPMLLTALGGCAGPEVIPELEKLMKLEPSRVGFYQSTIATIRARR